MDANFSTFVFLIYSLWLIIYCCCCVVAVCIVFLSPCNGILTCINTNRKRFIFLKPAENIFLNMQDELNYFKNTSGNSLETLLEALWCPLPSSMENIFAMPPCRMSYSFLLCFHSFLTTELHFSERLVNRQILLSVFYISSSISCFNLIVVVLWTTCK